MTGTHRSPSESSIFDVAVIGNGLIGAAASRYLSAAGLRVAAIGPDEPANWQTHNGVFASHYDQGRITRIIDPDDVWAALGARAIAAYAEIQEASGIRFHEPAGCLRVSPFYGRPDDTLAQAAQHGDAHGAYYQQLQPDQLAARFPFLHFASGSVALWEEGGAGYINPRSLVAAQLTIAARQGATVIRETVTHLEKAGGISRLTTDRGTVVRAAKVLIAAGGYTNHLLSRPLDLRVKTDTILLAQIDEEDGRRLQQMPSIIYRLAGNPVFYSIYALPPIRYPDGHLYLKIGGTVWRRAYRQTQAELADWFHGAGNEVEVDMLRQVLNEMVVDLRAVAYGSKPCITTYTAHDHPYVALLDEDGLGGQVYVAAGGCGAAAKSSNEIGRIAAQLVAHGEWRYDIPAEVFRAVYAPAPAPV